MEHRCVPLLFIHENDWFPDSPGSDTPLRRGPRSRISRPAVQEACPQAHTAVTIGARHWLSFDCTPGLTDRGASL